MAEPAQKRRRITPEEAAALLSIPDLPIETVLRIVVDLPVESIRALCAVNRRLRALCDDDFWRKILQSDLRKMESIVRDQPHGSGMLPALRYAVGPDADARDASRAFVVPTDALQRMYPPLTAEMFQMLATRWAMDSAVVGASVYMVLLADDRRGAGDPLDGHRFKYKGRRDLRRDDDPEVFGTPERWSGDPASAVRFPGGSFASIAGTIDRASRGKQSLAFTARPGIDLSSGYPQQRWIDEHHGREIPGDTLSVEPYVRMPADWQRETDYRVLVFTGHDVSGSERTPYLVDGHFRYAPDPWLGWKRRIGGMGLVNDNRIVPNAGVYQATDSALLTDSRGAPVGRVHMELFMLAVDTRPEPVEPGDPLERAREIRRRDAALSAEKDLRHRIGPYVHLRDVEIFRPRDVHKDHLFVAREERRSAFRLEEDEPPSFRALLSKPVESVALSSAADPAGRFALLSIDDDNNSAGEQVIVFDRHAGAPACEHVHRDGDAILAHLDAALRAGNPPTHPCPTCAASKE